jgi:hypothetical protein
MYTTITQKEKNDLQAKEEENAKNHGDFCGVTRSQAA